MKLERCHEGRVETTVNAKGPESTEEGEPPKEASNECGHKSEFDGEEEQAGSNKYTYVR